MVSRGELIPQSSRGLRSVTSSIGSYLLRFAPTHCLGRGHGGSGYPRPL